MTKVMRSQEELDIPEMLTINAGIDGIF